MVSSRRTVWVRNLRVLSVGVFFAGMGFSEVTPFLSLYIATLGHFSHQQLNFFSGLAFSAMYFVSAFISPVWGRLADRYGRKPMCLRAALGMAIVLGAMGLVTNTWQLAGLRFIIGIADASLFPQVQTLLTKNSPTTLTGHVFSWNQSAMYIGNMFGPIIGGLVAGSLGYAGVFLVTVGFVFINLSLFFVNVFLPLRKANH